MRRRRIESEPSRLTLGFNPSILYDEDEDDGSDAQNAVNQSQVNNLISILPPQPSTPVVTDQQSSILNRIKKYVACETMAVNNKSYHHPNPMIDMIDKETYKHTGINCELLRQKYGIQIERDIKPDSEHSLYQLVSELNVVLTTAKEWELYRLVKENKVTEYLKFRLQKFKTLTNLTTKQQKLYDCNQKARIAQKKIWDPLEYSSFGREEIDPTGHQQIRANNKYDAYKSTFKKMGLDSDSE